MFNWFKKKSAPPSTTDAVAVQREATATITLPAKSVELKNAGNAYLHQGNMDGAERCYRQALAIHPDYAEACTNLGLVLKERQLHAEATGYLVRAIALKPDLGRAYYHLSQIALEKNNRADAVQHLYQAIRHEPDFELAYLDLGHALFQDGKNENAKAVLAKGIAVNPNVSQLHLYLGNIYIAENNLDPAFLCLQKALALEPGFAEAHNSTGVVLRKQGKHEQAVDSFQKALAIHPDYADARYNLGMVLQDQGKLDQAIDCYRKVLNAIPDSASALNNLGNALLAQHKLDEAIDYYQKALASKPDYADAHSNLGIALQLQRRFEHARSCYQKALSIHPDHPDARLNRGFLSLIIGDLPRGWGDYEYRWKRKNADPQPKFVEPLWLGNASLAGKAILLYAEQGFGDTIQFIRYVKHVTALGATVFLQVQPALKSLLEKFPGTAQVLTAGEPMPAFDYHCPLLSLPLAFQTDLASIPSARSYVNPSLAKMQRWAHQLENHPGLRVGLVWSGNPKFKNDQNRSIPLQAFSPLWLKSNLHFFCLQKEIRDNDLALLQTIPAITNLAAQLIDFSETAAVIANLDLVITVDTSVAHLAGALGKPVWIMLPFMPDFRWLLDRTDSPWYPSARLFRQPAIGDWDSVIRDVLDALDTLKNEAA